MSVKPGPGLFITGTNTGVGKTHVGVAIARALAATGLRVGVYKPVLSGYLTDLSSCASTDLDSSRDDDVLLWKAAGSPGDLSRVSPQRFRAPLAPHLAARSEGRVVDPLQLRQGIRYWQERSDVVLVEGAGGLLSPITDEDYVADVAYEFGYSLVVVAPNTLGVINQTLQTLVTAAAYRDGLPVAAVILNQLPTESLDQDLSQASNLRELQTRCGVPVFQCSANAFDLSPAADWFELAARGQACRILPERFTLSLRPVSFNGEP